MAKQTKAASKKKNDPNQLIRHSWSRDPVQKIHSTKKGKKGYDRKKSKKESEEAEKETIQTENE